MAARKHITVFLWVLILSLILCACDMDALLDGFGFPNIGDDAPEQSIPTVSATDATSPTLPPVVTTSPTEAPAEPEPELYWVCAVGDLNVRNGPGRDYHSIGSVDDGTVVEPLRWVNGWAYIKYPIVGWCSGDYLHPLGWYNDVKLPEGREVQNQGLVGKWILATQPVSNGNERRTRAALIELRSDGTFTCSVANYISYGSSWKLIAYETDRPEWVGEYQFDGKTLTLDYMAYVNIVYDGHSGEMKSREWLSAAYTLEVPVTRSADSLCLTVPDGNAFPMYAGFATGTSTLNTLYRVPGTQEFPDDVCQTLKRWLS